MPLAQEEILIATRSAQFQIVYTKATACCLSVRLQDRKDTSSLWFTGVYGPSSPRTKVEFLEEIKSHKPQGTTPWILGGEFNITLNIQDRNRPANSADWRNTRQFAQLVSDLGLLNLNLQGRTFTWTNERDSPAMARLDRFLISNEWNLKYPNSSQKALLSTSSDHCPLSLTAKTSHMKTNFFRFENIWLKFEDLSQLVTETWQSEPTAHTPDTLQKKLNKLQTKIKNWSNSKIGSIEVHIKTCRDYMGWLDSARETRATTQLENLLLKDAKKRYNDLAVLEEDLWRQRAKLRWELHGDKGTKYFHAIASKNKRSSLISQIEHNGSLYTDHKTKA